MTSEERIEKLARELFEGELSQDEVWEAVSSGRAPGKTVVAAITEARRARYRAQAEEILRSKGEL